MAQFRCIRTCITNKRFYERDELADFKKCPSRHWVPADAPDVPVKTPRLGGKIGGTSPKGVPMRAPGKDEAVQASGEGEVE